MGLLLNYAGCAFAASNPVAITGIVVIGADLEDFSWTVGKNLSMIHLLRQAKACFWMTFAITSV